MMARLGIKKLINLKTVFLNSKRLVEITQQSFGVSELKDEIYKTSRKILIRIKTR